MNTNLFGKFVRLIPPIEYFLLALTIRVRKLCVLVQENKEKELQYEDDDIDYLPKVCLFLHLFAFMLTTVSTSLISEFRL